MPRSLGIGVETARKLLQLLNDAGLSGHHRLAILNADGKGKAVANNRDPLFFDDLIPSNYRREGILQRSKDAYMLIYTRAGYHCGSCVPERGCAASLRPATHAILESIQVRLRPVLCRLHGLVDRGT